MICPDCESMDTRVVETEPRKGGTVVYRRRECHACEGRWSTWEQRRWTTRDPAMFTARTDGGDS